MRRKDTGGKEQPLVENCIAPQFDINSEDTDDLSPTYEYKNHFFRCCTCRHCQNYNELQWLLIQLVWKDSPDPWDRCLHPSSILSSTVPCCCVQQLFPMDWPAVLWSQLLQEPPSARALTVGTGAGSCCFWYAPLRAVPKQQIPWLAWKV